jgi:hypothetical protein
MFPIQKYIQNSQHGQLLHFSCGVDLASQSWYLYKRNCEENRRMVPSQIVLTKAEIKRLPDGYVRMAVCKFSKMQAFVWNNKNPVHMFSTADTSTPRMHVVRQRGSTKLQIPSPLAIPKYNNGMQGVDRHAQLRSRFALASWHGFKNITSHISWPNWISILLIQAFCTSNLVQN